jgi:hypothetical protein
VTLDEYALEIAGNLRRAYNAKDHASIIDPIFRDADLTLTQSGISETSRTSFWATVRAYFQAPGLLIEKQANSALIALMQAIQKELAARETK